MKRDIKRQILRVALAVEKQGYRVSLCKGTLAKNFDIVATSVYSPALDSGIFIRVQINRISKEVLQSIIDYSPTERKKKEIWLVMFHEGSPNDPGRAFVFRCEGNRIIEYPAGLDLKEVLPKIFDLSEAMSSSLSDENVGVKSTKVEPKSAETGS